MNDNTRALKGSEKRDLFKWAHKNNMGWAAFYASDADLCLIADKPRRGVVAYLDYKGSGEGVTFTEKILYDEWTLTTPVYIVEAQDPNTGPFRIHLYETGGGLVYVCKLDNWKDFTKWEADLRREYSRNLP